MFSLAWCIIGLGNISVVWGEKYFYLSPSYLIIESRGVAFHEEGRSQWSLSVITYLYPPRAAGMEDVAAMKNFSFDFQSLLFPHFLPPEMCSTEDVVKILDQIVNDNLKANIYIQFQFPGNKNIWF